MSYVKPPVLSGTAKSDYENYLRTDELLSLQRGPNEWAHRDELLFTVVHQTSELWLKLAISEVKETVTQLQTNNLREAHRLLSRAVLCIEQNRNALNMLEKMSPRDYQEVRKALGHGSGFDSPGFIAIRRIIPEVGVEFRRLLAEKNLDILNLFLNDRKHEDLYQLAEWMLELDQELSLWRGKHLRVIGRSIGFEVQGTQGTPVQVLSKLEFFSFFPELWSIRSDITKLFQEN